MCVCVCVWCLCLADSFAECQTYLFTNIVSRVSGAIFWICFRIYQVITRSTQAVVPLLRNMDTTWNPWQSLVAFLFLTRCSVQFSLVAHSCLTLCDPMNCSMLGLPVHHQLPEFIQTHAHRVGDAIQPFHPLSSPSPPAPNPSQHQGLFQWVNSLHEVAKVLEFQLQHQSFQWTSRTNLL